MIIKYVLYVGILSVILETSTYAQFSRDYPRRPNSTLTIRNLNQRPLAKRAASAHKPNLYLQHFGPPGESYVAVSHGPASYHSLQDFSSGDSSFLLSEPSFVGVGTAKRRPYNGGFHVTDFKDEGPYFTAAGPPYGDWRGPRGRPRGPYASNRELFTPLKHPNRYPEGSYGASYAPNFFGPSSVFGGNQQPQCRAQPRCQKSKYRTLDGTCNNLKNPEWGAVGSPYNRLLPPKYADGVHAPPLSVSGKPLPEPRALSRALLPAMRKDDQHLTLAAMQFGQVITHDMSLALGTLPDPNTPECCSENGPLFKKLSKGEPCFPIVIAQDDPMYQKYRQTCMEFIRSTTDRTTGCPFGHGRDAKPLSAVSAYLDGSTVYGDGDSVSRNLRQFRGGRLKVETRRGQEWPPTNTNSTLACIRPAPEQVCYLTGDARVNQSPQLALIQILMHREHNRIATLLSELNPHWDDEKLFQETRRIMGAVMQHITYYEWLPVILGSKTCHESGISYEGAESYVDDYDPTVNPSVLNEHAHAAFRYFHTAIQGRLLLMTEARYSQGNLRLPEHMLDVSILEAGIFDDLARGMTTQAQHGIDRFHSQEVKENILRRPENPGAGFDLKSLDIHRGRDHGLASYNEYRQLCGLGKATRFEEFGDYIEPDNVRRLQNLYEHPDDVDLIIGATLEYHGGSKIGPTFTCILREQFFRTRVGDRFFFERGDHKAAFTPEQLFELRKSNFARMVCDNSEKVTTMQPKAFVQPSKTNPLVPCTELDQIPAMDLSAWKEIPIPS